MNVFEAICQIGLAGYLVFTIYWLRDWWRFNEWWRARPVLEWNPENVMVEWEPETSTIVFSDLVSAEVLLRHKCN